VRRRDRRPRVAAGLARLRDSRELNGTASPAISSTRLSPSAISGMNRCAIIVRAPCCHRLDDHIAVRIVGANAKYRCPAHPVERLGDRVAMGVDKAPTRSASRETRVGAMNSGNRAIAIFSL
jgi:hypothetical protein